jgi:MoaA/NifB/PqqE/SkfB family radical SAM enzyme
MQNPKFLFLSINELCNLHCQHCEYWGTKLPSLDASRLARQLEILQEFSEISPGGKVVICGGEPMLDVNTYFQVCATARALGLRTLSVTNGTMIKTPTHAARVAQTGPDEISISLDGPDAATHDRMRGTKGAFLEAVTAIKLLVAARDEMLEYATVYKWFPKIYVMGLLTASTAYKLDEFYDLVLNQLKADKLKINTLQPSFLNTRSGQQIQHDTFFVQESQLDVAHLDAVLAHCQQKYNLVYNPNWVRQVLSYFKTLQNRSDLHRGWGAGITTEEHICNSPDRNIMVDIAGKASLCFAPGFPSRQLHVYGDLKRYWETSNETRAKMANCNLLCGISHSVRRENATLKLL